MSMNRLNIKEANTHLQQLHQRVFELENQVQMQGIHIEELQRTNTELQHRMQAAIREKEASITELTSRLQQSEEHVEKLLEAAEERDATLVRLEARARLFYEVVEHRPVLARMVEVLEELSQTKPEEKRPPLVNGSGDASSSSSDSGAKLSGDHEEALKHISSTSSTDSPLHTADR